MIKELDLNGKNAVAPGWIETDLVRESLRRVPERRLISQRRKSKSTAA